MICSYSNLNYKQKLLVLEFMGRNNEQLTGLDDVDKLFNKKIYDYGKGALFYFVHEKVVAKICIVLEVVKELGTVYIHCLDNCEDLADGERIIKELITSAISVANMYGAKEILLGERAEKRVEILESIGYHVTYLALNMYLEDRKKKENCFSILPLTEYNKVDYLRIFNDSFSDMPHGTYACIQDIEEYINNTDDENYYFIVQNDNDNIGFLNCKIDNREGCFDIGLCKQYRGMGYGKQLLETAIDFLNRKKVDKLKLIVIEKNSVAYEMYKKRGFKKESVLSYWIRIK